MSAVQEKQFKNYLDCAEFIGECDKKMNVFYANVRDIKSLNTFEDLKIRIDCLGKPDVTLAETWLSVDEEKYFNIKDYSHYPLMREGKMGGRVPIYVNDKKWSSSLIKTLNSIHQIISVFVKNSYEEFYISTVFNPLIKNFCKFLDDFKSYIKEFQNDVKHIITGDFNLNLLSSDALSTEHLSEINKLGFINCNLIYPTRIAKTSATLIDHVLCNNNVKDWLLCNVIDYLSDHNTLVLTVITPKTNKHGTGRITKRLINYSKATKYFQQYPFSINCDNVNEAFDSFQKYVHEGIKASTYTITNRKKYQLHYKPWMNEKFMEICKRKQILYSISKRNPKNELILQEYKQCRNKVIAMKRMLINKYTSDKIRNGQGNQRKLWRVIKETLKL